MLEQLKKNQLAMTSGLENILMQKLPELEALEYEPKQDVAGMQIVYEPYGIKSSDANKKQLIVIINEDFDDYDILKLIFYDLENPNTLLMKSVNNEVDLDKYDKKISKILQNVGNKKSVLKKKGTKGDMKKYDDLTGDIDLLRRYKERVKSFKEGVKMTVKKTGTGYTQPKRNAYKISHGGQYGNLIINGTIAFSSK